MKSLVLVSLVIVSVQAASAASVKYHCTCIDTGLECDGGEKITLTLTETSSKTVITDADGDFPTQLNGILDESYSPKKNKNYLRFKTIHNATSPYVLISKGMVKGAKTGTLKSPQMTNDGSGFTWEYFYQCTLVD